MFYLDLFRQLEEKQVRYMLVGGLAMNLYGVPRMTMDVDIVLALDKDNLLAFIEAAKALRLKPIAPVNLEDLLDPGQRRAWSDEKGMIAFGLSSVQTNAPTVDILIDPPLDIDAALRRVEFRDIENTRVALASIEDIISLKEKTGREQDMADIEQLRRLQ